MNKIVERNRETLYMDILPLLFAIGGVLVGLIVSYISDSLIAIAPIMLGLLLFIFTPAVMNHIEAGRRNDVKQTVEIFMGEHKWIEFVELSLKYFGYETKILDENDEIKNNFIITNNNHLCYASEHNLSLSDLDKICKIAKDENKSLTLILNYKSITSNAYVVAKQNGIITYFRDDLYNGLYKTIKTKGGKPIRECLCT